MTATIGLLDTNVVVLAERLDPTLTEQGLLPEIALITAVTLAELTAGPLAAKTDRARAVRQRRLQQAEVMFEPLAFDAAAARAYAGVASTLRRAGPKPAARAFDALIAAIAVANDLPLYTCNPSAFQGIDGLAVTAVPHPDDKGT